MSLAPTPASRYDIHLWEGPDEGLPLMRAEFRQRGIPARDQAFARIRRVRQFKEVAVIKEP